MLFIRYLVYEPEAHPFAADLAPAEAPGPGLTLSAKPVATSTRRPAGCCTEVTLPRTRCRRDTEGLLVCLG